MSLNSKRLRIMAGSNGSGKITVLTEVRKNFYSGPFVNADEIEKVFSEKGLLNLPSLYNIEIEQKDFDKFINHEGKSWLEKAEKANAPISLSFKEGMLVAGDMVTSYDAAFAGTRLSTKLNWCYIWKQNYCLVRFVLRPC